MRCRRRAGRAAAGRLLIAVVTAALLAAMGPPTPAAAHAIVVEAVPAHEAQLTEPPARVLLRFNSRIEHRLSRVSIEAVGGRPVPLTILTGGAADGSGPDRLVVPLRPLPPGTYVVRYRVLAADGHLTEGALRFTIRAAQ